MMCLSSLRPIRLARDEKRATKWRRVGICSKLRKSEIRSICPFFDFVSPLLFRITESLNFGSYQTFFSSFKNCSCSLSYADVLLRKSGRIISLIGLLSSYFTRVYILKKMIKHNITNVLFAFLIILP